MLLLLINEHFVNSGCKDSIKKGYLYARGTITVIFHCKTFSL